MHKSLSNFISYALDALFPPRKTEQVVRDLTPNDLLALATLDGPLPYHDPQVRALVWELKYRNNAKAAALAGEYMSELLMAEAAESLGTPLLIPMPMHASRRKQRGYNQTELLCEAAMKFLNDSFEYAPDVLERVRNTPSQQGLARHKRLTNVKKSMQIKDPARVRGRVCIVVDDVSTTGATMAESQRALLRAGARSAHSVALARS